MIVKESELRAIISKLLSERFGGSYRFTGTPTSALLRKGGVGADADFSSGETSIKQGVKWGPGEGGSKREAAWGVLSYFLPNGSVLTSCYRTQADQDRIIRNYAQKYGYSGPDDLDKMLAFNRSKGLVIARNVGKGHGGTGGTGAFDVSGADLDAIWEGVEAANGDRLKAVKFKGLKGDGSIIERENNAVHIEFNLSDIDLEKCAQFLEEIKPEDDSATVAKDEEPATARPISLG